MLESGEARSCRGGLFAGWIETDYIFVQLLRVGQVHLAFFELSDLEQFLRLIRVTGGEDNTANNGPYIDPLSH
jgi:hypothetical protein